MPRGGRTPSRRSPLSSAASSPLSPIVADPSSIRALLERGDTLVTTVGPFARWGDAALDAAIDAGAHYIDSTGEPPFVRRVFEEAGPRAEASGTVAMTAMGYDWVPGQPDRRARAGRGRGRGRRQDRLLRHR